MRLVRLFVKQKTDKLSVTFYHRKPYDSYFSIERLFADIRRNMPAHIISRVAVSPFTSRGFWKRLANVLIAPLYQSEVNHITGDVNYIALLLDKKRTVLTIHDCVVLERLTGIKKSLFFFIWYWLPEKKSSIITVISQSAKSDLLRYIQCEPDKIRVIHNCIPSEFKPCHKLLNTAKPVLLQVGTRYNKNLLRVAEALQGIPCHLRIIGMLDNQQLSALSECHVEFSSVADISDEEIVNEYRQCDMLVFVSTYEGFGMPILEANAVGRPVITGNISSMPEVAGNAACLVDPFDVKSIRSGIVRILNDERYRTELVENGYKNVKRFESQNVAKQYSLIYDEIYQRNHAS
ncbi:MAG: hypothetical protein CXR31_05975 [Geobacter sp.]|nr:MAG: hypothetical protein CXR31_05975 [Geobacter sp.]